MIDIFGRAIVRALCLAGALTGAGGLSQYPEFAQQYTQRLAGQVDALSDVVADFDRSALAAGFTRAEALADLSGTAFLEARAGDMKDTFARHIILSNQLAELRNATALERITLAHTLRDTPTLRATWADFQPALPVTFAGVITAAIGFVAGWGIMAMIFGALSRMFHARPRAMATLQRVDPPLYDPDTGPRRQTPRLMGETRP